MSRPPKRDVRGRIDSALYFYCGRLLMKMSVNACRSLRRRSPMARLKNYNGKHYDIVINEFGRPGPCHDCPLAQRMEAGSVQLVTLRNIDRLREVHYDQAS